MVPNLAVFDIENLQAIDDMPFAHLTLATRNVAQSCVFFQEALGWQSIDRPNNIGRPAACQAIEFVADVKTIYQGEGGYNEDHEYFGELANI